MTALLNLLNFVRFTVLAVVLSMTGLGRANPANFTVQSVNGTNVFTLSAAKGKFVALHFLLKTECPYCLRHTREYAQNGATNSDVIHVFLKPDSEAEIKTWATQLGDSLKLPIYRDPEAKLAKAFQIPDGYKFHGHTMHFPALVLLDGDGKEVFRHIGRSNTDRYSYEKFEAKLKELTGPAPQ